MFVSQQYAANYHLVEDRDLSRAASERYLMLQAVHGNNRSTIGRRLRSPRQALRRLSRRG